jgi:hypothetical protein
MLRLHATPYEGLKCGAVHSACRLDPGLPETQRGSATITSESTPIRRVLPMSIDGTSCLTVSVPYVTNQSGCERAYIRP